LICAVCTANTTNQSFNFPYIVTLQMVAKVLLIIVCNRIGQDKCAPFPNSRPIGQNPNIYSKELCSHHGKVERELHYFVT
jgi:hypothetical protein